MFNTIRYKSNTSDPSLIIKSFDINATRIGYSIEKDEIYWTSEFEEFLKTGELKVTNIMTPSHTSVRIAKKSKELNAKLNEFEFKLLQYALTYKFIDRIKLRFRERYLDMCRDHKDMLSNYFQISKDLEAEEYVFGKTGEKDGHISENNGIMQPKTVIEISKPNNKSLHPTQKPVALFEYLIKTYTNEGDLVLDNCMGSGTTGVACKNINRNFIGIELDPEYFKIAEKRIKED
jgi:DNA modification methylase